MTSAPHSLVFGTYTERLPHVDGHATGILSATFDGNAVHDVSVEAEMRNPSWVTTTADGRFLYSVIETVEFEGRPGGGAAAYARDRETGALTLLNTVSSDGVEPAHIELDPNERFVLVANYRTGSVSVFARLADGGLGAMVEHVQHEGSSLHPIRQTGPHAHQIVFDPIAGDVLVPDLGLDAVIVYRFGDDGSLTERVDARIDVTPGAGPRHLAFHPDGAHLFLLNELDSSLLVLRRDGEHFVQTQRVSTLPPDVDEHNQTSAVRVSASGRSVLVSNRGYDSIAVFAFDVETATVELALVEPTLGKEPRDFVQSPDGSSIVVGNQDSDAVVTFAFDEDAPSLTFVSSIRVPTPVCVRFAS
ncbi:MAG: 6-phosphogluconolactonase [Subtercola sp.]|jgi:6-phosphogluconolactonase|nr:6-phosphogluconolactonase [Subtercola sp.]